MSEVLQAYFCEYLVVLMRLCNKVVVFCQKGYGLQLLYSLGSSFDLEFGSIQKELDQWGCLIQQQTQLLTTKMATKTRTGRFQDLKQRILRQISPNQNEYETRRRRQRKKGTCKWIFDSPNFKDWKSMQKSATLCVSGKLGSGKTVTLANMVARMNLDQTCAHAFCAFREPTSLEATNILGTIAYNLLEDLPAESKVEESQSKPFEPESIIELLLCLLPQNRKYIIIADGLEDCSNDDIDEVLLGLCRLMQKRVVLLCYSSRSDSRFEQVANQKLTPDFSVSHDDRNHDVELQAYILGEIQRRNESRHLPLDLEDLVKQQLILGAQGMSVPRKDAH